MINAPFLLGGLAAVAFLCGCFAVQWIVREGRRARVYSRLVVSSSTHAVAMHLRFRYTTHLLFASSSALGVVVFVNTRNILLTLLGAAGLYVVVKVTQRFLLQRELRAYEKEIPPVLDALSRSVRAGASLVRAYRDVAHGTDIRASAPRVHDDIVTLLQEIDMGIDFATALDRWRERRNIVAVRLCVLASHIAYETGGPTALAIESANTTIRQQLDVRQNVRTKATEARVSAYVIGAMPVLFLVPLVAISEEIRAFVLHSFVGTLVMCAGLAMNAIGWFAMQRMIEEAAQ